MNTTFTDAIGESRKELVRLIKGVDQGRPVWYYVRVEKAKFALYEARVKRKEQINLQDYGEILHSGWGDNPPENIQELYKD